MLEWTFQANSSICLQCPLNSFHVLLGATSVKSCQCNAGYTGTIEYSDSICTACPAGKFKDNAGNSTCQECPQNTYSEIAASLCIQCPANSSSAANSNSISDCLCDPGFKYSSLNGGSCEMCLEGTYKNSYANTVCLACEEGKFSSERGSIVCNDCNNNSQSFPLQGGEICKCNAGYIQNTTDLILPVCKPCKANQYQHLSGQTTCVDCPENSLSPIATESAMGCLCNDGYFQQDSLLPECQACAAGTYKEAAFSPDNDYLPCSTCPINSHSIHTSGSLTECICNAGYEGPDGGPCTACVPGKFKSLNGSAACQSCDIHYFSDEPASTICTSCVTFLNSDGAITEHNGSDTSDDCKCDLSQGFLQIFDELGKRTCSGCQVGTYAKSNGCQNCTGGQYADVGGLTACKDCLANSASYNYPHVACQCDKGYHGLPVSQNIADFTQKDDVTSWKNYGNSIGIVSGNLLWWGGNPPAIYSSDYNIAYFEMTLPVGYDTFTVSYANEYDTRWPGGTQVLIKINGVTVNVANKGESKIYSQAYKPGDIFRIEEHNALIGSDLEINVSSSEVVVCIPCAEAQYKNYTGNDLSCSACQENSVSQVASVSQDDCKCALGYRQDGPDTCVACLAGRYADTLDSITCTACGDRFYTAQSDFPWTSIAECTQCEVCNTTTNHAYVNHYDAANDDAGCGLGAPSECVACPTFSSLFQPSTEDNWNAGIDSCVCDADFYGPSGRPCVRCPTNSIRNFSDSNSSISDCVCDAGFEPDPSLANTCRACPVNTYKTGPGDYNCTACPDTLVTEFEGNTNIAACVCQPGYFYANSACEICGANTYKPGYNRDASCINCRDHSTSKVGSITSSDCECQPGYKLYLPDDVLNSIRIAIGEPNVCENNRDVNGICSAACPEQCYNWIGQTYAPYWQWPLGSYGVIQPCFAILAYEFGKTGMDSGTNVCTGGVDMTINTDDCELACNAVSPVYGHDGLGYIKHYNGYLARWRIFELYANDNENNVFTPITLKFMQWIPRNGPWITHSLNVWYNDQYQNIMDLSSFHNQYFYTEQPSSNTAAQCAVCELGRFKNFTSNSECQDCPVNTYTANVGSYSCSACESGKSTAGLLGQTYCECDAGTVRESSDVLSVCQDCAEGKFKAAASYNEPNCQNCSRCAANSQVATECNSTHDITCAPCQANSWFPDERSDLGVCYCNAGYELLGSECVACPIGKARRTNMNNSIACETCQDGKFADTENATECEFCAAYCNATISDGHNLTYNTYVIEECEITRDTVCAACTPCPPGQYAIQSCGIPFNNDRNDTKCAVCLAGSYCPGGVEGAGIDVQPKLCPDEALSEVGSDDISDCICNPGWYRTFDQCEICP